MAVERPICAWPMDAQGYGRLRDLRFADEPCVIPDGFRGWSVAVVDEPPPRKKPMPKHLPPPEPVETVPSVAVPSDLPDLKAVMPADGKVTGMTVVLALVAVAGSGAVLKLVKDYMDRRADLREKELEQQQQGQHSECETARAAHTARVQEALTAVVGRLDEVEARVALLAKRPKTKTKKS